MNAYGYVKGSNSSEPIELSEVTFLLTIEEIQNIIEFLNIVKEEHFKVSSQDGYSYSHLNHWKKDIKSNFDFIVASEGKLD